MSEKMTVVCVSCDTPVFHGRPCPFCDSSETVAIEIEPEAPVAGPVELRVLSGGRRDDERSAA